MDNFSHLIKSNKFVLVHFFAAWSSPSKRMNSNLEQLKSQVDESVSIIQVDIDKDPSLITSLRIDRLPTLMLFKLGCMVEQVAGVVQVSELKELIDFNNKS